MALSRFSALILLLTFSLFSSPLDFQSCQLKYQVSSQKTSTSLGLAIDEDYILFYSKQAVAVDEVNVSSEKSNLRGKIIKRDPFLGLNLVKANKKFKHIFKFYTNEPLQLASILPNDVTEGKIVSKQIGLNTLAKFSSKSKENSVIVGTCCGILGLSTGHGIIEKEYLQHFLQAKEIAYADIGISVANKNGVRVVEVNPFFIDSPFLLDDIIVYMDKKKSTSAQQLSRDILFSKAKSKHYFSILREGKSLQLEAIFSKRKSGGEVPDSYFDLFGLELNEKLFVKKDNKKYEIRKGDKLLYVMGKSVKTLANIRSILSQEKTSKNKDINLLFQRKGFDFFIHFIK
ncbi:hypothetical protein JHD50_02045 [Sulfurimonas sp. MAG313]|nr:PDZ domain-containing protein [Sulfurimonas sp. MAG313]MDF1880092.1 hypothetical protein [Sulfurimonas sp. MAG313]